MPPRIRVGLLAKLQLQQRHELLTAMHVALMHAALWGSARVRDLHHVERLDRETFHEAGIDTVDGGDGLG